MIVDLVKTTTDDGLRLDGALSQPNEGNLGPQYDVVVCVHGVGSNFYGSTLFELLIAPLNFRGISVLRVNTRGHDTLSTMNFAGTPRRMGAALENVDDCRLDINAWVRFLVEKSNPRPVRIILLGHSLGAIKVLYASAMGVPTQVVGVVAASAPRLSYTAFSQGPNSRDFLEAMSTAEMLVREGKPQSLFEARVPFPLVVGAEAYIDKYGPSDRYNVCRFLDRVSIPVLFLYGGLELEKGGVAFAGLPAEIISRQEQAQSFVVKEIPGADHFYTGVREAWTAEVANWITGYFNGSNSLSSN